LKLPAEPEGGYPGRGAGITPGRVSRAYGLDDAARERVHQALTATHAAHAGIDGIIFASAAWLIRAVRPAEETR